MTYSYIKRGIGIITYDFELSPDTYAVGSTYEDYIANKWVLLSDEHIAFRTEHPGCSFKEMFNLALNPTYTPTEEELLSRAKSRKLNEITTYDTSSNVNSFYLNGVAVWLDKAMRVGLMNSIGIEKAAGRTETTLWFETECYVIPVDVAIAMLHALELYALACYNKTAEHKAVVKEMTTVAEIEAYDHTIGYPDKLNLDTTSATGLAV